MTRQIRWPRTWRGWRTLFWLSLGRCPIHHTPLNIDNAPYDDGVDAYCFRCDGVAIWPQGAREALRQNYLACRVASDVAALPYEVHSASSPSSSVAYHAEASPAFPPHQAPPPRPGEQAGGRRGRGGK